MRGTLRRLRALGLSLADDSYRCDVVQGFVVGCSYVFICCFVFVWFRKEAGTFAIEDRFPEWGRYPMQLRWGVLQKN